MKNALTIAFVVADAVLLVVSLLLMCGGYLAWGAIALLAAGGLVFAAARFWLHTPEPMPATDREWFVWDEELDAELSEVERQMLRDGCVPVDPVIAHADLARTRREPGWPEAALLQPKHPVFRCHRQDNR